MRKILIIIAGIFGVILVLIILFTWLLARYVKDLESYTGDKTPEEQNNEVLLNEPLQSQKEDVLEIYSPLNQHVYFDSQLSIEGKSRSRYIFLTLNKASDRILTADTDGHFKTTVRLKDGVNQLSFLIFDTQGREFLKEMVVAYYPAGEDRVESLKAILGEVVNIDFNQKLFELANQKDQYEIKSNVDTLISNQGQDLNSLGDLEITQRVGVVLNDTKGYLAKQIDIDLYPYNFLAEVVGKEGDRLIVDRKKVGSPKPTVIIGPNSALLTWDMRDHLSHIDSDNISAGDLIYVNGYILPKENRINYYANRVLVYQK
jgi:hypothetical protein